MSYVAIAAMLVLVLLPLIVPALITVAHTILGTNRRSVRSVGRVQPAAA